MAGRDMTVAMSDGVQDKVVRPVVIGRLDIVGDPVKAWTGPGTFAPTGTGDAALDGQVFNTLAPFIDISPIMEGDGIGRPVTITLTGHDLDHVLLRQIIRDARKWRLQPAYLWFGLLQADEKTVMANPIRVKSGVMTMMRVREDKESAVVEVVIDEDHGKARGNPYLWIDHAKFFPGDIFSTFLIKLANKPRGLERSDVQRSGGGGGGGAGNWGSGMRPF